MQFNTLILLISGLAAQGLALGINCRGSGICHSDDSFGTTDYADQLAQNISTLHDDTWIPDAHNIACMKDICAFLQKTPEGGLHAKDVKPLAWAIVDHGCRACGSAPTTWPDNKDVKKVGELTFNYVGQDRVRCVPNFGEPLSYVGLCPDFEGAVE